MCTSSPSAACAKTHSERRAIFACRHQTWQGECSRSTTHQTCHIRRDATEARVVVPDVHLQADAVDRDAAPLHGGNHLVDGVAFALAAHLERQLGHRVQLNGLLRGGRDVVVVVEELSAVHLARCIEGHVEVVGHVGVPHRILEGPTRRWAVADGLVDNVPRKGVGAIVGGDDLGVIRQKCRLLCATEATLREPGRVVAAPAQIVPAERHLVLAGKIAHRVARGKIEGAARRTNRSPLARVLRGHQIVLLCQLCRIRAVTLDVPS
eukprot:4553747-Prymnesium_polylepis.2